MVNWTKDQTALLISLLERCPLLYNSNHPDYSNRIKRDQIYDCIRKEISWVKPDITVADVKTKIRTLRNQYAREKKKVINWKLSGAGDENNYVPTFWGFHELKFLDLFVTVDSSGGDASILTNNDTYYEESEQPYLDYNNQRFTPSIQASNVQDDSISPITNLSTPPSNTVKKPRMQDISSKEDVFCTFLCHELKNIHCDHIFQEAKWQILDVVREAINKDKLESAYPPLLSAVKQEETHSTSPTPPLVQYSPMYDTKQNLTFAEKPQEETNDNNKKVEV